MFIIKKKAFRNFQRKSPFESFRAYILIFAKYRKSKEKIRRKTTFENKNYKEVCRCQINITARSVLNATA